MIETFDLRPYQETTVSKLYESYARGNRRPVTIVPTGGGKTVIGTRVVADCVAAGGWSLWLAHRTELIDAAEEKMLQDTSGMDVGVLQGRRREFGRQVVVGSVATVMQPGALSVITKNPPRLVVVDECHHAAARSYLKILDALGVRQQGGPLGYGITATLDRADGLALGDVWDDIAHVVEMRELIRDGFLLPPRAVHVQVDGMDLRSVRKTRSESGFDDKAVGQIMSDSLAPAAIARAYLEHAKGRKAVAFLPTVELSKEQARVFCEHGVKAIHVDADTPKAVRKEIVRRVKLGEYDVTCNVGLFTEGTDVPIWDVAILGRLTSSATLFTQMIGRPLRPYPGQDHALILDAVGVTRRQKLATLKNLFGADRPEDLPDDLRELLDAADDLEPKSEDDGPAGHDEPEGADGALVATLIDLFSASHTAWLRSPRGVWFLPTGDGRAVLLAPGQDVERYDVLWSTGELVHEDSLPLDNAMTWGEKAAREVARRPLERAAGWRNVQAKKIDRLSAIYAGARPDEIRTVGDVRDVQDARWAATAVDTLPAVEKVTPAGYWTT